MLLKNKNITVVGAGCTGVATSNFLVSKEASVVLIDIKSRVELEKNLLSLSPGVRTLFGCSEIPESSSLIVLSPGVNINASFLEESRRRGVQIISEIELAFRFTKTPIIAVTGTNGKSTVTTLIGDILKQAGKKIAVGGNLGAPFVALLEQDPVDYFVLEISTFQLEGIKTFRPNIAVILNITPDHLDRHKTLEEYADLKGRVSAFQNDGDILVLNKDDENVMKQGKRSKAKKVFFSLRGKVDEGAYLEDGSMFTCSDGKEKRILSVGDLKTAMQFQAENLLSSMVVATLVNAANSDITSVAMKFEGLDHRVEWVRTVRGIDFVNDSKGTNVGALQKSLKVFSRPIILIAGGKDKGGDFRVLKNLFKEKVKHLVLIGETKNKLREVLNGSSSYEDAESMEDAVERSMEKATAGDIVLLSPGCSSFDMFKDFIERGNQFKEIVGRL
ncbi:UDP-N-acetylmuramoyl-L-alanine--D-glutamate ligase [Nitrospinaceae bacterium]|nr:UDP-N-acetylmuramoyl-L-alanine--D-glutamate ligase [Nitrospinaceae bacterium]